MLKAVYDAARFGLREGLSVREAGAMAGALLRTP